MSVAESLCEVFGELEHPHAVVHPFCSDELFVDILNNLAPSEMLQIIRKLTCTGRDCFLMMKALIDRGADIHTLDPVTRSNVFFEKKMTPELFNLLLKNGGSDLLNEENNFKLTPIMFVRNAAIARMFIEHGANVNARNHTGLTVLTLIKHGVFDLRRNNVARQHRQEIVDVLVEAGAIE